jgi:hypothetical protein
MDMEIITLAFSVLSTILAVVALYKIHRVEIHIVRQNVESEASDDELYERAKFIVEHKE